MNCDRIARWYRWLEYAAFGKRLERCRNYYLHCVSDASKVLMLGEGDGRFLKTFAAVSMRSDIDYVDVSAAMLAIARHRLAGARGAENRSVRFFRSDVQNDEPLPGSSYDLVITHFFLDCFNDQEIDKVVSTIAGSTLANARWLVSEFRQPIRGVWKYAALCILYATYVFFRWTTGLETHRLPSYRSALTSNGFFLEREQTFLGGLLVSQLWRREASVHVV
jgi:ubiquinone/menaquinone biosynthesis C-methylase UbiE